MPKAVIFCFAFPKWGLKISYAFFLGLQSHDTLGPAQMRQFDCSKLNCGVAFGTFVQFGLKWNWTHKHGRTARLRHNVHVFLLKKDSRFNRSCAPFWRQWLRERSVPEACLLIPVVIKCMFNTNNRSAVAANASFPQHTSFLSEPNKSHLGLQSPSRSLAEHPAVCCTAQCQYIPGLSSVTVPMSATRAEGNCSDLSRDSQTQGRNFEPELPNRPRISIFLFHSERGPPNV